MNEPTLVVLVGVVAAAGTVSFGRFISRGASHSKRSAWRLAELGLLLAYVGFILSGALGWIGLGGSLALIGCILVILSISRINRPE
jgi:hypothetical protein